ncbi:MAG TPA: aminopeptidase [Pyrinomonadaceae bacterium]|jgi:leucyl aminopeptidase (aminopeptidase T)
MNWKLIAVLAFGIAVFAACQPVTTSNNSNAPANANNANTNKANTNATSSTSKAAPTDLKKLAERIVTQSAGVKENENVLISGSARDMELLENLVIEVEKAGGNAMLEINSENMTKRSYAEVPEKYDSKEPKLGIALAKAFNVTISVDSSETEGLLADVPPARLAARSKASVPVGDEFIKNKIRNVNVGNELYPTEWRAKRFEMAPDAFAKLFWEGVNIDYTSLQATGEKARTAFAGKEVEITHPNGTNIKFNIESKPAYISDGIISADDVAKGNFDVYLPAGEAAVIPAANSGTGKFVIEKDFFNGKEVHNITLNFENGKLTSMTGEGEGFAALKADYDARGEGKEILSYLDLGINPNYVLSPSTKFGNWVSAGMVSLGTGNNVWAGGTNNSTGAAGGHLAGATVKIDGKVVIENGTLKL